MSDAGEAIVLPLFTNKISKEARDVRVEAMQIRQDLYAGTLESVSADLAVGNLSFLTSGFFQQRMFDDEYCCIARKRHRKPNQDLPIDDYVQLENILVSNETLNRL